MCLGLQGLLWHCEVLSIRLYPTLGTWGRVRIVTHLMKALLIVLWALRSG